MSVTHPLKEDKKIVKNDETFKKYKRLGYIYDDKENSFTIPSKEAESAFINGMTVHDFVINRDDPLVQLNRLEVRTKVLLKKALRRLGGIKFNVGLAIELIKNNNGVEETGIFNFIEEAITITRASETDDVLNTVKEKILRRIDRFTNGASGWAVNRITRHYVNINKNKPLRGSSYIPLPDKINNKQATINVQNKNDDKCFIYCLARRFDPNPEKNHLERVSKHLKKVCSDLKYDNIECPVTMKDIPKIEKQFNITINIFGHNDEGLFPIKLNKNVVDLSKHIDLLITSNDEMNHYIWIKDFNRLCHTQTKHQGKKHFCKNCIQCFSSEKVLEEHKPNCMILNGAQAVGLPKEGSTLEFKSLNKTIPVPFVIYADLEALLKPLEVCENDEKNGKSFTIKTHEHITCSYGYKVVCFENDKYTKPFKMYKGKDAVHKFF